eukprot:2332031-Ditylum_brightwellii.AAC.1
MEAMKIDLTTTLRAKLKTIVTESTKAAVKDIRAEMKDYMMNEVKSLISSVDSQLSALFQWFEATHSNTTPPPETPPGNQVGYQATGHITPNLPHNIKQREHNPYPSHPYYSTTYAPAPTQSPDTDQLWLMHQQYAAQQQNINFQKGRVRNQATHQTVKGPSSEEQSSTDGTGEE